MTINNALACRVGAVVIGRNEGQRLRLCLTSIIGAVERLVYVDSGSTDGSVALARAMGAEVVELDAAVSFTAARALPGCMGLRRNGIACEMFCRVGSGESGYPWLLSFWLGRRVARRFYCFWWAT